MLILGLDTTGRSFSVALLNDGEVLGEITENAARGQAGLVMDALERLFDLTGKKPSGLDGVAVTNGPGGFSGVRLGVSIAKGICMGAEKPAAAVSSLACLAFQAMEPVGAVWAVLDCLRNEVYAASYVFGPEGPVETSAASVMKPGELAESLSGPCVLVGDGAVKYAGLLTGDGKARLADESSHTIRASSVAILGSRLLPAAEPDSADLLGPLYLRLSDARLPEKPLC
ncbi:MAG: tRNA (adenosine(37)-N6)-threonylcarbamoyltransferase complex dimerization subunit type 1 TsaB [Deltaproteobacteria bacterium]|nr:tRNA (adenosine(37)-N6)-threonylcarbamoyltransferase complex dimerization subunit type 1 TsaB [Deltaproteobacteria bacterium]